MRPLFELSSIRKYYGATLALNLPRLTILQGGLYLLAGPNGSGKSTLLSILALLAPPDGGELRFSGRKITWRGRELRDLRRRITLLHQTPYLFQGTVAANIAYGLHLRGMNGEQQRRAVDEALSQVCLSGFASRQACELSGGEARRVALARALAIRPEILLLDEPLANVDQRSSDLLEGLIGDLHRQGTTVVISGHDPQLALRMDCEVISLRCGSLSEPASADGADPYRKELLLCQPLKMREA